MNTLDSIQAKAGKDVSATIADDLGVLITKNAEALKEADGLRAQIKELTSRNEKLIASNGALLQQVAMGGEDNNRRNRTETEQEDAPKNISLKDCFDSRGNFIQ